jgi:hypothetical protein
LNGIVYKTHPETWETQIVVAFTGASGANPGKALVGRLCKTGDRWLWGTTREGGSSEMGSLFRLDELTGACREMLTFTGTDGAFPGAQPLGELYADATGNLWGGDQVGWQLRWRCGFQVPDIDRNLHGHRPFQRHQRPTSQQQRAFCQPRTANCHSPCSIFIRPSSMLLASAATLATSIHRHLPSWLDRQPLF